MKKYTQMTLEESRQDYLDEKDTREKARKKRVWRSMKWAEQERRTSRVELDAKT